MMVTKHGMLSLRHINELLCAAAKQPPWTFVNLLLYMVAPTKFLMRACSASMWGTAFSFELINFVEPGAHRRLAEKQTLTMPIFYVFDLLVHWLPLVVLYIPSSLCVYQDSFCKVTAVVLNVTWGVLLTGGSMDLSNVYVKMSIRKWYVMWASAIFFTMAAP